MTNKWSRIWGLAWACWCGLAAALCIWPSDELAWLVACWFVLQEGAAIYNRHDPRPALTEELHRYIPGWITFPVLGLGVYRMNQLGVSTWVCVGAWAWLAWHFTTVYDDEGIKPW